MTFRIDQRSTGDTPTIEFQGLLDQTALATLVARLGADARDVGLLLRAGTTIEAGCLEPLLAITGLRVAAESPFLTHLISESRP